MSHKLIGSCQPAAPNYYFIDIPVFSRYNKEKTFKEAIIMENEELLQEEETSTLMLTDENGVDTEFEYLDCIEYDGKEYLVLLPLDDEEGAIVILEVEPVD